MSLKNILVLILLTTSQWLSAQTDSVKVQYSEELVDEFKSNLNLEFIPIRKGIMTNHQNFFKIGLTLAQPFSELGGLIEYREFGPTSLDVSYERKLLKSSLSVEVRLANNLGWSYYYAYNEFTRNGPISEQETILNKSTLHLSLRYYHLQKKRINRGRGGNHLYGSYFFISGKNLLAWAEKRRQTYHYTAFGGGLVREVKQNKINSGPALIRFGYGLQTRFLKHGYIDLNIGSNISPNATPFEIISLPDFNLTLGFGLVK